MVGGKSPLGMATLLLIAPLVFVMSFFANIYVHELGHFAVASYFDLSPSLHLSSETFQSGSAFFSSDLTPLAYVEFVGTSDPIQDFLVTIAGVFANFIFVILGVVGYIFVKRKSYSYDFIFLAVLVPALLSIFLNMSAASPLSDGYHLFELLMNK